MHKQLWLLFFGRLDDEKWFWTILEVLKLFIKNNWTIPFQFYVFGKWKYESELLELWQTHKEIHFFGRQPLETIKKYQENYDFCLMPSSFLETFWLSALNALSMWIPVIGPAKWWLNQFIPDKYDILKSEWQNDKEKLYCKLIWIIKDFNEWKINIESERQTAIKTAQNYTTEKRIENIKPIIGKPKKILLVSDFKSKLWWIETYLYDVQEILNKNGYEVEIYWTNIPWWKVWKLLKYFWIIFSIWNLVNAIRLKKKVQEFMPKVIRFNSTLRWLGRAPIKAVKDYDAKKIMMYHDLGYFHPFPSQVTKEDMVYTPLNLKNFIKSAKTKNPLKIIPIIRKYWTVCLLKNQLVKTIDLHTAPSSFMEKIIADSYQISPENIKTISHFIQK